MAGYATQYCQTAVTSNDGTATILLSCEKLAPTTYRITIEGDGVTGLGGSSLATVVNNNTAKKSVKFFENGQIYFRLDGQVYDTFGRIVK